MNYENKIGFMKDLLGFPGYGYEMNGQGASRAISDLVDNKVKKDLFLMCFFLLKCIMKKKTMQYCLMPCISPWQSSFPGGR